jgi:hypothetical protein
MNSFGKFGFVVNRVITHSSTALRRRDAKQTSFAFREIYARGASPLC